MPMLSDFYRRVNELENTITDCNRRRVALATQASTEEPTMADLAPMLRRLPILADQLADPPPGHLRALFETLQFDIAHHPAEGALDVSLTLHDEGGFESSEGNASVDCSVPPVGLEPTLEEILSLPPLPNWGTGALRL